MNSIVILAVCLTYGGISALETKDSVHLTLFYESYCPYSIDFFVKQLLESWKYFKSHLLVDLVPFGNAQQYYKDGHFHFNCQHGPKECTANILHACAIYEVCGIKGSKQCPEDKLKLAMNYITCVMQQPDQKEASNKCAREAGLDIKVLNSCAQSALGERLESRYGNQTKAFNKPPITYVPFIVINSKHNKTMEDDAQTDLKALICSYIPAVCK